MPPFVRDDVPLVWYPEDQEEQQDQDPIPNEEPPILEVNFLTLRLDAVLQEVTDSVEHLVDGDGQGPGTLQQRITAYFNLLREFRITVDMKLSLSQQPNTAATAMAHLALNAQLNRLVREISEFYDTYLRG
ncbi:GL14701 [Drosophila persimilis]|uniref:GL14701 n=1 Tax=Drosophila persimilis TaxID=7234 RepID=B4GVQ5_DROPE|nr:GL14701 [Drosophila persimilis]